MLTFADFKVQDGLIWRRDGTAWTTANPGDCAVYAQKLRNALGEIRLRTNAYAGDENWPLVSGINLVAKSALAEDGK